MRSTTLAASHCTLAPNTLGRMLMVARAIAVEPPRMTKGWTYRSPNPAMTDQASPSLMEYRRLARISSGVADA